MTDVEQKIQGLKQVIPTLEASALQMSDGKGHVAKCGEHLYAACRELEKAVAELEKAAAE